MPKWLVVARNEYRIHTSRIRKIRSYFPYLVVGLLLVYLVFIAPFFVGLFIDDLLALFLSQAAIATMQITLFLVFVYFMIIPITGTLREEQTGQLEIFLAAPIKPSDVLLGEFLGEMPFYAILLVLVAGFLTAVLNSLGLSVVQKLITVSIFVIIFLSAFWIGNVIAAILRTKLGKTARGKDIGRALAMIIALPLVALIYAIQFGGFLEILADPGKSAMVRTALGLLPSSWGAELIIAFASNPGNIAAMGFETITRFGGLITFFVAVLLLGTKVVGRFYSLEPTSFTASVAKPDGVFYKTVKYVGGGGSFGTLVVSIFKEFGRRLENLSNITYIVGILVLMNIFITPNILRGSSDPYSLVMAQFMFPMLAVMVSGGVTVEGKEKLFIYKKTPRGVGRLVKARFIQCCLVVTPIVCVITAVITLLSPQTTLFALLAYTGLMTLIAAANVAFSLGLFLLNPAFSEKSVRLGLNVIVVQFTSIAFFVVSMLTLIRGEGLVGGLFYVLMLQTALSWLAGIAILYLGKRKLSRME